MLVYRVEHPIFGGPFRGNGDGPPAHMSDYDYDRMANLSKHNPDCPLPPCPFDDVRATFGNLATKRFDQFVSKTAIPSGLKPSDLIWGFANREQLELWFPNPCINILRRYDFTEAMYSIPDEKCLVLQTQAGWFRQHAKLINRQELSFITPKRKAA